VRRGSGTRRWLRQVAGALAVAAVVLAGAVAPRLLRELDHFRIERVEVVGTRFSEPYAVVRAAGIAAGSSLFDDAATWRAGVLSLPLVAEVRVRRHFPSGLTLEVREVEPVALVASPELRPVDASGRLIALEPAGTILDLPILSGVAVADSTLAQGAEEPALRLLLLMRAREPGLVDRVSQIDRTVDGLRLVLRQGGPDALLPLHTRDVHLTQLRLAYADLGARGELARVRRIDVRFRDQIVVSFLRTPVS
jgi:cell division septal protein FtsQ